MSRTRGLSYAMLALGIFCLAVNVALAQEPADTYQVSYYSNAQIVSPQATVHIVNPGTAITTINGNGGPTSGDLCADIYVFNNDEQEVECCSCLLTPDSERTLGIHTNLLNNPVNNGNNTTDGVIKIVSTASVTVKGAQTCPFPNGDTSITPTAGLRAWSTHWQNHGTTGFSETEEEFSSAPLSSFELEYVELGCSAISTSGSGKGVCSCGYGD